MRDAAAGGIGRPLGAVDAAREGSTRAGPTRLSSGTAGGGGARTALATGASRTAAALDAHAGAPMEGSDAGSELLLGRVVAVDRATAHAIRPPATTPPTAIAASGIVSGACVAVVAREPGDAKADPISVAANAAREAGCADEDVTPTPAFAPAPPPAFAPAPAPGSHPRPRSHPLPRSRPHPRPRPRPGG